MSLALGVGPNMAVCLAVRSRPGSVTFLTYLLPPGIDVEFVAARVALHAATPASGARPVAGLLASGALARFSAAVRGNGPAQAQRDARSLRLDVGHRVLQHGTRLVGAGDVLLFHRRRQLAAGARRDVCPRGRRSRSAVVRVHSKTGEGAAARAGGRARHTDRALHWRIGRRR